MLDTIQIETSPNPTAAVIWMHGLGADGNDFAPIIGELNLKGTQGIRFVFPHAPHIPVTINNGFIMRAWYDILTTDLVRREDEKGLRESQLLIEELIADQVAKGIPRNKIVLAGFSQGCAMTLQVGLRHSQALAGLLCLSGYVPLADTTATERHPANQNTPIFMVHGRGDPIIPISRAEASRDLLNSLGYNVEWHEYLMPHSVCAEEIDDIGDWFRKILRSDN